MLYLHLAEGFEEIEAVTIVDILRRARFDIQTVSLTGSLEVTGAHGITVSADTVIEKADYDEHSHESDLLADDRKDEVVLRFRHI